MEDSSSQKNEDQLIARRELSTRLSTGSFFWGLISGNCSPEERLDARTERLKRKTGAEYFVIEAHGSRAVYHIPIDSAHQSGWSECYLTREVAFYKKKN